MASQHGQRLGETTNEARLRNLVTQCQIERAEIELMDLRQKHASMKAQRLLEVSPTNDTGYDVATLRGKLIMDENTPLDYSNVKTMDNKANITVKFQNINDDRNIPACLPEYQLHYRLPQLLEEDVDDTTGDGSLAAPYLTINHAYSTISSATTTDRWAINVGPGRFDETGDIVIKPWIWLIGTQRTATRVTSSTNVVRLDSAFTNGNYRLGMMNILFFGSTNVNFDLQALGDSGSTVFESDSMYVNNIFTFKGRTTADFVEIWNSQILANCNFYSLQGLMKNCYCGGDILVTDLGGTENIYFDVIDTYYNGNFTITQTLNNVFICKLLNSNINGGTLALTSTGTLNIGADAPSLPANVTTSDVLTLTRATPATSVGYVPAVPANWAGTAPATIQAAIDRLAAQVSVLGGVPVP